MCQYLCRCRHAVCAQAHSPHGCLVMGWSCVEHNDPVKTTYIGSDLLSRDNEWRYTVSKARALSYMRRTELNSTSLALPTFINNRLHRAADGQRFIVPKAMDRWLIGQGYMTRPKPEWRDDGFEDFCVDLCEFFERTGNPMDAILQGKMSTRSVVGDSSDDGDDDESDGTSDDEDLVIERMPAWRPSSTPELSLLLKTPPGSPSLTDVSDSEGEESNRYRHLQEHRLYSLSELANAESMNYIPLKPAIQGLDKLDGESYGLTELAAIGEDTNFADDDLDSTAESSTYEQQSDELEDQEFHRQLWRDGVISGLSRKSFSASSLKAHSYFEPADVEIISRHVTASNEADPQMTNSFRSEISRSSLGSLSDASQCTSLSSRTDPSLVDLKISGSLISTSRPRTMSGQSHRSSIQRNPDGSFLTSRYSTWESESRRSSACYSASTCAAAGNDDHSLETKKSEDIFLLIAQEEVRQAA